MGVLEPTFTRCHVRSLLGCWAVRADLCQLQGRKAQPLSKEPCSSETASKPAFGDSDLTCTKAHRWTSFVLSSRKKSQIAFRKEQSCTGDGPSTLHVFISTGIETKSRRSGPRVPSSSHVSRPMADPEMAGFSPKHNLNLLISLSPLLAPCACCYFTSWWLRFLIYKMGWFHPLLKDVINHICT